MKFFGIKTLVFKIPFKLALQILFNVLKLFDIVLNLKFNFNNLKIRTFKAWNKLWKPEENLEKACGNPAFMKYKIV